MENNVVTLDTAKKLKAAGFPQTAPDHWVLNHPNNHEQSKQLNRVISSSKRQDSPYITYFAAPTAQEIADQLPTYGIISVSKRYSGSNWKAMMHEVMSKPADTSVEAPTMAEALASLFIKLSESKENIE